MSKRKNSFTPGKSNDPIPEPQSTAGYSDKPTQKSKRLALAIDNWLTDKKAAMIIASVGLVTYATGLLAPFWNDDFGQIVNNPVVHSLANIGSFFSEGTFYNQGLGMIMIGGFYRPMMATAFSIVYTLFGLHSIGYHVLQLALGISSAIFLFLVFRYSFSRILSLGLSLVFLVHPIDSQVLFAIPSMQDALYFFFGILALWIILRYNSHRTLIVASGSLFLALLSKETAVLFIICCLLYLWMFDPRRLKYFAYCVSVVALAYAALYIHSTKYVSLPRGSAPINVLGLGQRLLTAPSVATFYLGKLVWPRGLATGYYWVVTSPSLGGFWLPLSIDVVLIALVVWIGVIIKRHAPSSEFKTYAFFTAWMILAMALIVQVVPLDMTACETWFYFSMAGFLGAVGVVIKNLLPQNFLRYQRAYLVLAALLIVLLGTRTALRGLDWENTTTLDYLDIKYSAQDFGAYDRLAAAVANTGHLQAAVVYDEKSIQLYPAYYNYQNLALTMTKLGNYRGAVAQYRKALGFRLTLANNLLHPTLDSAASLDSLYGTQADAENLIEAGLSYYPNDYNLWMDLAIVDAKAHNVEGTNHALAAAQHLGPVDDAMAYKMLTGQPFSVRYSGKLIQLP
jgi:hypothetical protein